jgi:hypothetical protein
LRYLKFRGYWLCNWIGNERLDTRVELKGIYATYEMKKNYPDMRILDETDKYFLGHIFEDAYKLTDDQRRAINEARQQIKNGEFLTDEQANKEIDEWLTR